MIRIYLIHREELEKITYTPEQLSSLRREKIEKLKREEAKQLSACAELLLIYALRREFPETSLPLELEADERGKLQLKDIPLYFNLSHAKDYAACAISDAPIGVDIESFRVKELMSPDRILHPDEAKMLAFISNSNEKKKFFYECWVAKESYLKNLGIGLIVRPRDFAVSEDSLKIGDHEYEPPKGHHKETEILRQSAASAGSDGSSAQKEGADNTLQENLSYLEKRYVHVLEPGEIRGSDWKFDAGYRVAVCSMEKDRDSIARLIKAEDINEILLK